jgi:hypothetical protein
VTTGRRDYHTKWIPTIMGEHWAALVDQLESTLKAIGLFPRLS